MKQKSIFYLILLGSMILTFFMFTGGITDTTYNFAAPTLSSFAVGTSSPIIYDKLPFSISALNHHYKHNCDDEYYTARDLVGSLTITQGTAVVDTSSFIFVSETGGDKNGYTGSFADSVVMNNAGTYTATATFYDSQDPDKEKSTMTLQFTVGLGSEIPLSAGTYQLSTFTAACASSTQPPYTYTNTSASNTLVINPDGLTASLNINMQMGSNVLTQYPCLGDSSYNYNASGNFSVVKENGAKYLKIEYENSAYVNFNFSFDGTNLGLNYSKNGSNYVLNFVKQ
jgi:hypothetical protein